MGESLQRCFENITSVVVPESGDFVPEEQSEAMAEALLNRKRLFFRRGGEALALAY